MPGPLTYTALALMTRDRVRQVRDFLAGRIASGDANDIEKQIKYLADKAYQLMSGGDVDDRRVGEPAIEPPVLLYGPPIGREKVAKFLLMGALGPELPAYAALANPGQSWLRDTMHKGSPDAHREHVLVGSTRFPFEFWRLVRPRLRSAISDQAKRDAALRNMQSYVLGHLCHVAADVISSPFIDDVQWHLGQGARAKLSRAQVVGAIEDHIAATYFRRSASDWTKNWSDWWPSAGDVPDAFFEAYKEALELDTLFGSGARRPGFGDYEARRQANPPEALSAELLQRGYIAVRTMFGAVRDWSFGQWLGFTAPLFVAPLLALPLFAAMPEGKKRFREPEPDGIEKAVADYEITVMPFAATAIVPFIVTIIAQCSPLFDSRSMLVSWISAIVQVVAAIAFFASLGNIDKDDLWAPWLFLFAIPVALEIIQLVLTSVWSESYSMRQFLSLSSALHIILSLGLALLYRGFLHQAAHGLDDDYDKADAGDFWGLFAAWFGILLLIWFFTGLIMHLAFSPTVPRTGLEGDDRDTFVTGQRHHLRLFDDTTLFRAPSDSSPTLADLHYPSGRRQLLKMWWTGDNPASAKVRSMRDRLIFKFHNNVERTIHAPLAPTTLADFAINLKRMVKDGGDNARLETKIVHDGDLDYELPAGLVFSDGGDDQDTVATHDAQAALDRDLGTSEADAYVLYHAPKGHLATRFGRRGPVTGGHAHGADANAPDAADRVRTAAANARQIQRTAGTTDFRLFFRPGDRVFSGAQRRVIVSVDSATQVTVSTPFSPALAAGGVAFGRGQIDRTSDEAANAAWRVRSPLGTENFGPNDIVGTAGALFGHMFKVGDLIRVRPSAASGKQAQTHEIVAILGDTRMTLATPLVPAIVAGDNAQFTRLADEKAEGFDFISDPDDMIFAGDSIMNHAADLGVLLCLGGTSRLLSDSERTASPDRFAHELKKVYQVFRNWNLDRRRINEWRMLVGGGAISEKRGDVTAADPAAPTEAGWTAGPVGGEKFSNQLGWVNVLRSWLDMARRPGTDTRAQSSFKPGDPKNLELSQALAFLFDMRDPA